MKLTPEQREGWQRIAKLLEELAEPTPSELLEEELRRWIPIALANAVDRRLSLRKAAQWIQNHLRPSRKKRLWVYGLKHTCDHWYHQHNGSCYVTERDFTDVLRREGYTARHGYVHAVERD